MSLVVTNWLLIAYDLPLGDAELKDAIFVPCFHMIKIS